MTLAGCGGESSSTDQAALASPGSGWLIVDWTIAGVSEAEACDRTHSATIGVTVKREDGESQRVYQQACQTFNTTIALAAGHYTAEGVLLDGADGDLTAPVPLQPFEITGEVPLWLAIEFPESSFHAEEVAKR